jgi:hypothetical protein
MPDGDYEYTDISIEDFIAALGIYLDRLEREAKANTPAWDKIAWTLAPSGLTGVENIGERFDRIYGEILDAVDMYGLSPEVARLLPPEASQIFSTTLKNRANYEWQKQYKGDLDKWAKDVVKAQSQYYGDYSQYLRDVESNLRWRTEFGAQQAQRQYQNELAQWQTQEQARGELWRRWETQQGVKEARWNAEQARWANMAMGMGGRDNTQMAKAWSAAMGEAIGMLDPNRDWARISDLKRLQNPYEPAESNVNQLWEDYESQRAETDRWAKMEKDVMSRYQDPKDPLYIGEAGEDMTPEQWRAHRILTSAKIAKDKLLELEGRLAEEATYAWGDPISGGIDTGVGGRSYGEDPGIPTSWHPETPDWLSRMYGTTEEAKLWGTRGGARPTLGPPSPQAWQRLSQPEQQRWMGYAEYLGADPAKLLGQMGQMLPQRKAGTRWQPARQRVSV